MKRQIKLTESEFKKVIKECVKNIISERNRFERGMSDTEIKRRRLDNFMKDIDAPKNIFDKHFPEPCVSDYATEPECGWNDYFDNQRIRQHRSRQNKNKNLDEAFSDVVQWKHFDNSDIDNNYYKSFVVLDGTEANLGNFDSYDDAVEYANELAYNNKYGTYNVYGCDKNGYSTDDEDNTLVYSTDDEVC
jgi:hypothetical protein